MTCTYSGGPRFATGSDLTKISRFPATRQGLVGCIETSLSYASSKQSSNMEYVPSDAGQQSYILCADCGTVIDSSNGSGLCKWELLPAGIVA